MWPATALAKMQPIQPLTKADKVLVVTALPTRALVWEMSAVKNFLLDTKNKEAKDAFVHICNERLLKKLIHRDEVRP